MKNLTRPGGGIALFIMAGGLWFLLAHFIPDGLARGISTIVAGVAFAGVYVWLLVARVRRVFIQYHEDDNGKVRRELQLAIVDVALLLVGFAVIYQQFGIIDQTQSGHPITRNFWSCLYFSFVTFTTLGFGDFYPHEWSRAVASIQSITGYIVLGLMASTSASLLQSAGKNRAND